MTLESSLGNAGVRHTIEFGGRTYVASFAVQKVKTALSMWLKKRAYEPILAMEAAGAGVASIDRAIARFSARCEAGEFEFDGAKAKALLDPSLFADVEGKPPPAEAVEAAFAFVGAVFGCDGSTAAAMMNAKPTEVKLIMELVTRASFTPPKEPGAA